MRGTPSGGTGSGSRLPSDVEGWIEVLVGADAEAEASPGTRRVGSFLAALSRATTAEDLARVVAEQPRPTRLPPPVAELVRRVERAPERGRRPGGSSSRLRARRSTARVVNGWTGRPPGEPSAPPAQGAVPVDRVMKLARKLDKLVHIAQERGRDAAASQVRLAAREAAPPVGEARPAERPEGGDGAIAALVREVLFEVTRELELRRERRPESNDDHDIWW